MAARLHSKMRNHLRKRRYANPLEIDEDVSATLLAWKFGEEEMKIDKVIKLLLKPCAFSTL